MFERSVWASYDVVYRRQAANHGSLNWDVVDPALYNEAFAGQASWFLDVGTAWPTHMARRSAFIRHQTGLVGALPRLMAVLLAHSALESCWEGHLRWLKYAVSIIWQVGRIVASRNAETLTSARSANAHIQRPSAGRDTGIASPQSALRLPPRSS